MRLDDLLYSLFVEPIRNLKRLARGSRLRKALATAIISNLLCRKVYIVIINLSIFQCIKGLGKGPPFCFLDFCNLLDFGFVKHIGEFYQRIQKRQIFDLFSIQIARFISTYVYDPCNLNRKEAKIIQKIDEP